MKETGIRFIKGQPLTADSLNAMNDKINELVGVINLLLKDRVNVNIEVLQNTNPISIEDALASVPADRRIPGVTIKFNGPEGWETWIWKGETWENQGNWIRVAIDSDVIDGGEL